VDKAEAREWEDLGKHTGCEHVWDIALITDKLYRCTRVVECRNCGYRAKEEKLSMCCS